MSLQYYSPTTSFSDFLTTLSQQLSLSDGQPNSELNLELIERQVNAMFHQQLLQSLTEERIKNQLLTNALLKCSLQLDLQKQIQQSRTQSTVEKISNNEGKNLPVKLQEVSSKQNLQYESPIESYEGRRRPRRRRDCTTRKNPIMKPIKNETKNIPKNFGKAIAAFIQRNDELAREVVGRFPDLDYAQFILDIRQRRKTINSIADLRSLWITEENKFAAPTRILSSVFLKKHSLQYIFRSRITHYEGHIKYRNRLLEAVKNPKGFNSIKCY